MTIFKNQISIDRPVTDVYAFLADCNNHEQLMPDGISDWSSTTDEARFTVQNMVKLALKVDRRTENSEVAFIPAEKPPFDVSLRWHVTGIDDAATTAELVVEADLNRMMKMVAQKPLQKLVDSQVTALKHILEA